VEAEASTLGADRLLSKPQPLARLAAEVSALLDGTPGPTDS
jgi:hypothetical protein